MEIKFNTLRPWLEEILLVIKKDIKTDYLPAMQAMYKSYFGSRPVNRLQNEEIHAALIQELENGNEDLAEWIVNRWVFKHGELYQFFASSLEKIQPDFSSLDQLTIDQSQMILSRAKDLFPIKEVYFFSVLNGVVFPQEIFEQLKNEVQTASERKKVEAEVDLKEREVSKIVENHQREIDRITSKYEKKLEGVLKKYMQDTHALKAQIRALQKK